MDADSHLISVDVEGQRYIGHWTLRGDEILVVSAHGSSTIPLSRAHPDAAARRVLREIVLENAKPRP